MSEHTVQCVHCKRAFDVCKLQDAREAAGLETPRSKLRGVNRYYAAWYVEWGHARQFAWMCADCAAKFRAPAIPRYGRKVEYAYPPAGQDYLKWLWKNRRKLKYRLKNYSEATS